MLSELSYRHQPHQFAQPNFPSQSLSQEYSSHGRTFCNLPKQALGASAGPAEDFQSQARTLSCNGIFHQQTNWPKEQSLPLCSVSPFPHRLVTSTAYTNNDVESEHMLRRKTPNGTLAAGYDGSPIEWTKRPHAMKHLLTPTSRPSQATAILPTLTTPLSASPVEHHGQSFCVRAGLQQAYGSSLKGPSVNEIFLKDSTMEYGSKRGSIKLGGVDSVLNQSSLYHSSNVAGISSVPTVLQPMWPPCPGPTSLQTPAPIGPYWPNGAFEPYRPAPLRNSRLQYDSLSQNANRDARVRRSNPTMMQPSQISEAGSLPQGGNTALRYEQQSTQDAAQDLNRLHGSRHGSLPHVFHSKLELGQDQRVDETFTCSLVGEESLMNNSRLTSSPCHSTAFIGHAQFNEKVLHWAYRIYCSLLVSIEQSRREQGMNDAQATASLPFSQPPRRPYPCWSMRTTSTMGNIGNYRISKAEAPPEFAIPSFASRTQLKESKLQLNRTFRRLHTGEGSINHTDSTQQPWALNTWPFRSDHLVAHPSYLSPQLTANHHSQAPTAAAANAMEILSRLCQESQWRWADGMLLNGCLAYGMGDYPKAVKWYLKVLQQDPDNVEAMSNVAATFLSLGQRREAEKYWMQAIKLRPSYFEAVEHLVGFLYEEHRGREAIRLIEYVESALLNDQALTSTCHKVCSSPQRQFSSGYAIPASENGRLLALIHGKGNAIYQSADNSGAAQAFEDAILIGVGQHHGGIRGLIERVLRVFLDQRQQDRKLAVEEPMQPEPILLPPEAALETARLAFPPFGNLPGLQDVPNGMSHKAAVSIISNSLLSLAKIYQDGMTSSGASAATPRATSGVQEILALYYLSLSLLPSPSTANNVGILLAGIQQSARISHHVAPLKGQNMTFPGVTPGSGIALALAYYDYGLKLDARHAHLYTNLGSLFKDIGQLSAAIKMYEKAVECDGNFDIALANLANAVKDKGNIKEAIQYYKRAVASNPDFAEAVCGLANALNSVCNWSGRGGIGHHQGSWDRWHVDKHGVLFDSKSCSASSSGWIGQVVTIVDRQLQDGKTWGKGVFHSSGITLLISQLEHSCYGKVETDRLRRTMKVWAEENWEGAKVVRLVERATKRLGWLLFQEKYMHRPGLSVNRLRPQLPAVLAIPSAPTVLPFHTFTSPLSARHIRMISQRNGLRVSCSTLRASWLPSHAYEPPPPPNPHLNIGYISSDFNNHPLAHLMQSVFGLHNPSRFKAFCYATTSSDGSVHRQQIEHESPVFYDASSWSIERLVNQVVADKIHILINLNGYTRGAKNEVFAARPAPIQMSFMGFAGTLGAEWCDYLLADTTAIPPGSLRPFRRNVDLEDQTKDCNNDDDADDWVYGENIIFTRDTFFCCDHRQSAPDAHEQQLSWLDEQTRRWKMRKELFPELADDAVILGNFNQLYKVNIYKSPSQTSNLLIQGPD